MIVYYLSDRDPADKLIRHRACSLRDNAYALIKAELDSDFEDKCREISKNRKDVNSEENVKKTDDHHTEVSSVKVEKKYSTSPGGGVVVNGRKYSSSRKRKIPAWARGYVKKVHKKKKIMFETNSTTIETPSKTSSTGETVASIDLDKFQEFETEAHNVLNGHTELFDNTDSEDDEINDKPKEAKTSLPDNILEQSSVPMPNESSNSTDAANVGGTNRVENAGSSSSSRRESTDDLTFAFESDSSPSKPGDNAKVIIDKEELESAWRQTVQFTSDFSVEILCDIYVQLSRCVGKFSQTYDRKSLPKVTINFNPLPTCQIYSNSISSFRNIFESKL